MNISHRKSDASKSSNLPSRNNKIVLPSWIIAILVVAAFVYQYFFNGSPAPETPASPITPTLIAAAPPTITVPRPPSVVNSSSSAKSNFDFYLLALSWSPDYCATNGNNDPQQCSIGKKLGFVLHGLWPQYNQGYPSNCSTVKLPDAVQAKFPGLYPSTALYDHEWEKHGTCSGLSPEQYLTLSKRLKESVTIPSVYRAPEQPFRTTAAQLAKDFIASNPSVNESSLAVNCSGAGRFFQELYVCFTPEGAPTACSREVKNDAAKSCGSPDFLVRNVR